MKILELSPYRKNKINLEDYDYKQDIKNRLIMSRFAEREKEILEEILYSPPKISIKMLAENLNLEPSEILDCLKKLEETGLYQLEGTDTIHVNKEVRKYFEAHLPKIEGEFFIPNMEFLQNLLRKVPIHILPIWYHIPRTSNNIFDSLIEKYLFTPQIFQRYLKELNLGDDILGGIVEDVFGSEDLKVSSGFLMKKYHLSPEAFEEYILHLEFNFVCCLGTEKIGDTWHEIVTPFFEWRQYLLFLRKTIPIPIADKDSIRCLRQGEYAFAEDMTALLKKPISLKEISSLLGVSDKNYIDTLIKKACLLKFASIQQDILNPLEDAKNWLELSLEDRALQLYRHPLNEMQVDHFPNEVASKRNLREIEKSICRAIDKGWVVFSDFLKGMTTSLSEENKIVLKKNGRQWQYALPEYTEVEKQFIKTVILDGLFEGGIIAKGMYGDEPCFQVTSLGKALFGE